MSFKLDPSFKTAYRQAVSEALDKAASAGSAHLAENLSGTEGSGVHYPGLPNRSSAEGEYPVQQSGELHAGVDWQPTNDPMLKEVFIAGNDEGKLLGLEFSPPSQNPNREGAPKRTSGGRAPMWRTFSDPQTHERMLQVMGVE